MVETRVLRPTLIKVIFFISFLSTNHYTREYKKQEKGSA